MSEDEFSDYWVNKHGPLATEWLLRCGILRYVQVSTALILHMIYMFIHLT